MLPIKYIEGNLVKNHQDEWWAFYHMNLYNYSFTSEDEKKQTFNRLAHMFSQVKTSDIHVLVCSVEESIDKAFDNCRDFPVGSLKNNAYALLDETKDIVTGKPLDDYLYDVDALPDGDRTYYYDRGVQVEYVHYVGFRLLPNSETGLHGTAHSFMKTLRGVVQGISHTAMGDFTTVSKTELRQYTGIENLLYSRISSFFRFQRLDADTMGYVVQHLTGTNPGPVEDYLYHLPSEDTGDGKSRRVRTYDILKLDGELITETPKHLCFGEKGHETYCTYLAVRDITSDLVFPGCEVFYAQPAQLDFPIDTSVRVEVLEHRTALRKLRDQKARIKDIEDHAWKTYNDAGGDVGIALEDAEGLETSMNMNRETMYEVSYLIRITAPSWEELNARREEVITFYSGYNINLECPSGDMMNFFQEFIPSGTRKNQHVNYFLTDILACLGIGAGTIVGDKSGIPIGHTTYTNNLVCIRPWLGAQGAAGTVTNSLSLAFVGAMGGGKSMSSNLLVLFSVLFGARSVIIDPKAERGHWKEAFPQMADEINIVRLTKEEKNRGILDPFLMFDKVEDCEELALDVLTYLLGINIQAADRYPFLEQAIKNVSARPVRGLLMVIDELQALNIPEAQYMARHLKSFANIGLAGLLFSNGIQHNTIDLNKRLSIIQVDDLMLPHKDKPQDECMAKEMLSVAVMMAVSTFNLKFIRAYPKDFKIVNIDEAWSLLNVAQGAQLTNRLNREGRAMNAGVYYSVQNATDLKDAGVRNSLGMVFVFRLTDREEIVSALDLLGVDADEYNIEAVRQLENGQCIMRDLYGRVNTIKFDVVVPQIFNAFDTRPTSMNEQGE